ncbi:flavodoxin family protein [Aphelenchoides avenae]|nr:flavodoxin family protein [Aphelenchus avenae]
MTELSTTNSLLILYGSETGTAQDVAESFWRDAKHRRLPVRVFEFDDYAVEAKKCVLCIAATSGQGEVPTNMRVNWRRLLKKGLPEDLLSDLHVAVFGLGDSSYQQFNFAGKKLFRRLQQIGAQVLLELGLGDDQHELGLDGALDSWRKGFWHKIEQLQLFPEMLTDYNEDELLPPRYFLDWVGSTSDIVPIEDVSGHPIRHDYRPLTLVANERVTALDHFQDTRLLTFSTESYREHTDDPFRYAPGDVLMVYPRNLQESVDIAIEAMRILPEVLDREFSIRENDRNIPLPSAWLLPSPTTLRQCLERYFDLQAVPRRSLFELLAKVATDKMEKDRLRELSSPEGLDDYLDYCQRPRRTVAEMLRDFPRTAKDLRPEHLFDIFTPIRARAFSIASSPRAHEGKIQLLVAKVEYKARRMVDPRRGLCSTYLSRLTPGATVLSKIRPGTFRLGGVEPLVMIGPGTGVAPFRSMIADAHSKPEDRRMLLFFGCRYSQKDYYFRDEWPSYANLELVTAFSRDEAGKKVYVQDKIAEHAATVWRYLSDPKAKVLVAGSANEMPKAVTEAIKQVAAANGVDDSERFFEQLELQGRLQFETWS